MKKFKFALKNSILIVVLFSIFIACEQDFSSIDSDVINEGTATNFNTTSESFEVITYSDALGPIQTNNIGVNLLGIYDDPNYGRTTANVVTQVASNVINPTFGENIVLDSVVLAISYFSTNIGAGDDNILDFELDSVFPRGNGTEFSPIKLTLYENNYFLRDFDPTAVFNTPQSYYSNQSASPIELIPDSELEGTLIHVEDTLLISSEGIILTDGAIEEPMVTESGPPSIRIKLDNLSYWRNKILERGGTPELSNVNNFNNFFRGIYFKVEPINNDGTMMVLSFAEQGTNNADITLFYTEDSDILGERVQQTFTLTFGPNRANFFKNDFNVPLNDGDEVNGDSRLFLKGGEGSIAAIRLFNGENMDSDNSTDNVFEAWRKQFVNLNEDGTFQSSRRLVNEANLVFFVDPILVNGEEPERLYLYDRGNNVPLADYFTDLAISTDPNSSIVNHLGVLERENEEPNAQGIRYKMIITSHINNLLIQDSTNVELGLSLSSDVNLEGTVPQRSQQINNSIINNIPVSSIISPRGTILHGSNSEDPSRRVFLEIFYTCLNTDDDCEENN
ncbi:DUF4270 domain-containing protein [Winogradskyella immobilis]|uniref:DUF4270 domain-containing protein n=1 Tax=Winogradskyella immobilis TaxID=2816852 RepID=A0ABS8EPZ2_9FLAO|nr:DUF4270 domain-containing protein [Winogradskyella immobilis]MCC1485298.1 DUF4270 domain-containing protein [Winogradskyella immobilis]MCG0017390.1 DUF4270 domain-containing protein [Winogradskyella immobilis]